MTSPIGSNSTRSSRLAGLDLRSVKVLSVSGKTRTVTEWMLPKGSYLNYHVLTSPSWAQYQCVVTCLTDRTSDRSHDIMNGCSDSGARIRPHSNAEPLEVGAPAMCCSMREGTRKSTAEGTSEYDLWRVKVRGGCDGNCCTQSKASLIEVFFIYTRRLPEGVTLQVSAHAPAACVPEANGNEGVSAERLQAGQQPAAADGNR